MYADSTKDKTIHSVMEEPFGVSIWRWHCRRPMHKMYWTTDDKRRLNFSCYECVKCGGRKGFKIRIQDFLGPIGHFIRIK